MDEFRKSPNWKKDYKLSVILAAVLAENGDFAGAVKSMKRAMTIEPKRKVSCQKVIDRFESGKPWRL